MRYRLKRFIKFGFSKKRNLILMTVVSVFIVTICICLYNSMFPKNGSSILKSKAASKITLITSEAVNVYLSENKKDTEKILYPMFDADGKITSYNVNTNSIEKARYEITEMVNEMLKRDSKVTSKVRIGSLTGNNYLTGKGLNIKIYGNTVCAVTSEIFTETISMGINQALYRITVDVKVDCKLFVGDKVENIIVTTKHVIAERLIFGNVPLT